MKDLNPLAIDPSQLSKLTPLEREELVFLQKRFLPLLGPVAHALNNHRDRNDEIPGNGAQESRKEVFR